MQKAARTKAVAPNTIHRNGNTRRLLEKARATIAAAATLMTPRTPSASGSRDRGTSPTAAVGSSHRRQPWISPIDTTVETVTTAILSLSRNRENAEAAIESIAIRNRETSARDSTGARLASAPAASCPALRVAINKPHWKIRISGLMAVVGAARDRRVPPTDAGGMDSRQIASTRRSAPSRSLKAGRACSTMRTLLMDLDVDSIRCQNDEGHAVRDPVPRSDSPGGWG